MKRTALLALLAVAIAAPGCSKKSEPVSTPPVDQTEGENTTPGTPAQAPPPGAAPIQAPPVSGVLAQGGSLTNENASANLDMLTHALKRWIVRNKRMPRSFEDFAATSGLQIPPPPAGKKYAIDSQGRVILMDR